MNETVKQASPRASVLVGPENLVHNKSEFKTLGGRDSSLGLGHPCARNDY